MNWLGQQFSNTNFAPLVKTAANILSFGGFAQGENDAFQRKMREQEYQREQQKAQEEARQRELLLARQRAMTGAVGGFYGGQSPSPQQATQQPMQPSQQAPTQHNIPQMPDMTPPIDQNAQMGSAQNPERVSVTGQRQIPQMEKRPINPYEQADLLDAQANALLQLAQQGDYGAITEHQALKKQANDLRQSIDTHGQQLLSSVIAPAYQVQDDPTTPDNEHEMAMLDAWSQLGAMGFKPDAHVRALLERGGFQADALLRQIVNQGDMKEAAQAEIKRQNTPYQTDNLGDRYGIFNPVTGQYVGSEAIGLNPTQVRGQNITRENNIRSNSTSRANNAASVGASIANNRRSVGVARERLGLDREKFKYDKSYYGDNPPTNLYQPNEVEWDIPQ